MRIQAALGGRLRFAATARRMRERLLTGGLWDSFVYVCYRSRGFLARYATWLALDLLEVLGLALVAEPRIFNLSISFTVGNLLLLAVIEALSFSYRSAWLSGKRPRAGLFGIAGGLSVPAIFALTSGMFAADIVLDPRSRFLFATRLAASTLVFLLWARTFPITMTRRIRFPTWVNLAQLGVGACGLGAAASLPATTAFYFPPLCAAAARLAGELYFWLQARRMAASPVHAGAALEGPATPWPQLQTALVMASPVIPLLALCLVARDRLFELPLLALGLLSSVATKFLHRPFRALTVELNRALSFRAVDEFRILWSQALRLSMGALAVCAPLALLPPLLSPKALGPELPVWFLAMGFNWILISAWVSANQPERVFGPVVGVRYLVFPVAMAVVPASYHLLSLALTELALGVFLFAAHRRAGGAPEQDRDARLSGFLGGAGKSVRVEGLLIEHWRLQGFRPGVAADPETIARFAEETLSRRALAFALRRSAFVLLCADPPSGGMDRLRTALWKAEPLRTRAIRDIAEGDRVRPPAFSGDGALLRAARVWRRNGTRWRSPEGKPSDGERAALEVCCRAGRADAAIAMVSHAPIPGTSRVLVAFRRFGRIARIYEVEASSAETKALWLEAVHLRQFWFHHRAAQRLCGVRRRRAARPRPRALASLALVLLLPTLAETAWAEGEARLSCDASSPSGPLMLKDMDSGRSYALPELSFRASPYVLPTVACEGWLQSFTPPLRIEFSPLVSGQGFPSARLLGPGRDRLHDLCTRSPQCKVTFPYDWLAFRPFARLRQFFAADRSRELLSASCASAPEPTAPRPIDPGELKPLELGSLRSPRIWFSPDTSLTSETERMITESGPSDRPAWVISTMGASIPEIQRLRELTVLRPGLRIFVLFDLNSHLLMGNLLQLAALSDSRLILVPIFGSPFNRKYFHIKGAFDLAHPSRFVLTTGNLKAHVNHPIFDLGISGEAKDGDASFASSAARLLLGNCGSLERLECTLDAYFGKAGARERAQISAWAATACAEVGADPRFGELASNPRDGFALASGERDVERLLETLIDGARSRVLLVTHQLHKPSLLDRLERLRARGVDVTVFLGSGALGADSGSSARHPGLIAQALPGRRLELHTRALLVDGKRLLLGTGSLTQSGLRDSAELFTYTEDPLLVSAFHGYLGGTLSNFRLPRGWTGLPAAPRPGAHDAAVMPPLLARIPREEGSQALERAAAWIVPRENPELYEARGALLDCLRQEPALIAEWDRVDACLRALKE